MIRLLSLIAMLGAFHVLTASLAGAAVVIDADALVRFNPDARGLSLTSVGRPGQPASPTNLVQVQTFTANTAGRLYGIDLQIFKPTTFLPGTLTISLIDGDYLAGARTVKGLQQVAIADLRSLASGRDLEPLLRFDTSSFGLGVSVGSRFSVLFAVEPEGQFATAGLLIGNTLGGPPMPQGPIIPNVERSNYAGGALVLLRPDGSPQAPGANDIGFRTLVDTATPVPEPGSWALLLTGFAITGMVARRRRPWTA